jgi:DNA-binding MarR family transcriptional regulator
MAPLPLNHIEESAWRGFLRIHAGLTTDMSANLNAVYALTLAEYELLMHLYEHPAERMPMSELARLVSLTPSGITRMIDRLVLRGLVGRQSIRSDARVQHAVLTDEGRSVFVAASSTHLGDVRTRFVDVLSEEELVVVAAVWARMEANKPS